MDPKGKAQIFTICNYLQEAASMHAHMAGLGFDHMIKRNQVWVLTRLKVEIAKYPVWNDQLKLKTWSRGNEGIFYLRDFIISDQKGEEIIKATSSWAAINLKTRRPELVKGLEDMLYSQKENIALEEKLEKLPEIENPRLMKEYQVQYTDIDIVYHVNNVKYIEMIVNAFPLEKHKSSKIKSLEVNYLGETNYQDHVQIFSQSSEAAAKDQLVSIVRKSDSKEVCKARLVWY
jgi:acyl-ACP thioesterase